MKILEAEHICKSFGQTEGAEGYQLFSGRKPGTVHHRFFRKWKNHASALPELSWNSRTMV